MTSEFAAQKGPGTQKMFPFDDVIMVREAGGERIESFPHYSALFKFLQIISVLSSYTCRH